MPPPLKEILDSEDEDDLLPIKARSPVVTSHSGEHAPMDADQATSTASTGELLRRAHLALMAPTQDVNDVSNSAPTVVPTNNGKKRRLTGEEPEPRSSGKLKRIKPATHEPSSHPSELTVPGPTFPDQPPPFVGTSDTIPGETFPSISQTEQDIEKKAPKTKPRRSSQQHASSAEQMSSLTPWSASAIDSSNRLNSDDAAIGLPKELYKPRPSRSRSAQVDVTPLDYSKVPEKVVKKAKRAKTDTKENSSNESIFPPRPILQAPEVERLSPYPDQSIPLDTVIAETPAESTMLGTPASGKTDKVTKKPAKPKQPGKRGRPRKNPIIEEPDELASDETISVAKPATPEPALKPEVQVLISPSRLKPASNETVLPEHNPELINNILAGLGHTKSAESTPQPVPKKPAKRGRKPSATKAESNEVMNSHTAVEREPMPAAEPEVEVEPVEEVLESVSSAPVMKLTVDSDAVESKTPQTAKKAAGRSSPTRPSWQKTPYRVGLSKTQRIPSLLKVFKK